MAQPPESFLRVVRVIDTISEWCGRAVAWMIVPLVAGLTFEVISRYGFDRPTEWAFDVTYMLYGSHFMLGAAYTLLRGAHIRTDMFYEKFSTRRKGLVDAIGYLVFFFPSMIFLLVAGWDAAVVSWQMGERSEISPWRPIIYPFKAVVPATALLLFLQGISEFLKSVYMAKTGTTYDHKETILV
jgi:TRAP-type mannitol/chloroaromatic compound transport system permease small subunit